MSSYQLYVLLLVSIILYIYTACENQSTKLLLFARRKYQCWAGMHARHHMPGAPEPGMSMSHAPRASKFGQSHMPGPLQILQLD